MTRSPSSPDVRWKQRLKNFQQAFSLLHAATELSKSRALTELEKQGLIQAFEFTHELAWNVMRDYFLDQGNSTITGSKDAAREAFQKGLISEGEIWMEMIRSRNQTSHTYNKSTAEDITNKIVSNYGPAFQIFLNKMLELAAK